MKKIFDLSVFAASVVLLVACGQKPETEEIMESDAAPDPVAEAHVQESGVQSIDADGNIAPFGMASRKPVAVDEPAVEPAAADVVAQEGGPSSALYGVHCAACHGANAQGIPGLGLNLVKSELVASASQEELGEFLKAGRAADSPDSVTKVPMPAFSWMGADDLAQITVYLKSL